MCTIIHMYTYLQITHTHVHTYVRKDHSLRPYVHCTPVRYVYKHKLPSKKRKMPVEDAQIIIYSLIEGSVALYPTEAPCQVSLISSRCVRSTYPPPAVCPPAYTIVFVELVRMMSCMYVMLLIMYMYMYTCRKYST